MLPSSVWTDLNSALDVKFISTQKIFFGKNYSNIHVTWNFFSKFLPAFSTQTLLIFFDSRIGRIYKVTLDLRRVDSEKGKGFGLIDTP
ncbi:hypothetical protein CH373_02060 [Leptospira perolatii]|uniref:Uncharacterized protein n=1 Tax=Leptospira perolatii TaxID=2023191 RepID=A0A2M9ZS39_9LEPT|nr:hypothetical protein CH360_02060 [Leptospira perolatii]PJZ74845.1 hypothetical protein CH373_02060 [Leptospira perolatii]